jgi:threonine aldolase
MQLASKNRYIAIQFNAILKDNLGLTIASYTNDLAKYFEQEITKINNKAIAYPIQTNMVFLKMKQELYDKLTTSINFYYWDKDLQEARIAFSFSNTKEEINYFIKTYKKAMKEML